MNCGNGPLNFRKDRCTMDETGQAQNVYRSDPLPPHGIGLGSPEILKINQNPANIGRNYMQDLNCLLQRKVAERPCCNSHFILPKKSTPKKDSM